MARLSTWWARVKRGVRAYRAPLSVTITTDVETLPASAPVGVGQSRHEVLRVVKGKPFTLYEGPSGAAARRWFEHVTSHKEAGTMRHLHDGIVRGFYQGPD